MKARPVEKLAADFWDRVGYKEPFPRSLERAILSAAPVFIVKVHCQRLDTSYVRGWLRDREVSLLTPWKERPLNGCLVAHRGQAAIFLDGTLSAEEMRVVVAHEFGHYLAEYEWPRSLALRRLGSSILDVLDGDRMAIANEQIAATLANVAIGVYVHYMDRSGDSTTAGLVAQVEDTADMVGAELLAPRAVLATQANRIGTTDGHAGLVEVLRTRFGLPESYAKWYSQRIVSEMCNKKSFCEILGF